MGDDDVATNEGLLVAWDTIGDAAMREAIRAFWSSSGDAMAVSDADGLVLLANPAYYQLYGYSPGDVVGQSFAVIFPESERAAAVERYRAVFRGPASTAAFEAVVRRADGSERVVDSRYTFLLRGDRRIAMLSTVRDITESKHLEAELREEVETLEILNRTGQQVAAELDLRALVQTVTDAATTLTGAGFGAFFYNVHDARGEAYTLYTLAGVAAEAFADFPMPRNTAIFGPTFRGEGILRLADVTADPRYGHNAPYAGMPAGHLPVRSYLAVPVVSRSGEVLGGLFFGHPEPGLFTARHERLVVGLAGQAAVAIDNARLVEAVREAVRAREGFLAIAAHELRTPITMLKGTVQLVTRQLRRADFDRDRALVQLGRLEGRIDHLTTLVGDILDVSQLRQGHLGLHQTRLDLVALARDVLAHFAEAPERSPAHELTLDADDQLWLDADPGRLEQVLTNLIANALKYSPEGGEVRCTIRREGDRALLAVRDHGLGIAPEVQGQLFKPFARVDQERAIRGLGLGLYITRELVERHGGAIDLDSAPGEGTVVTIRLPLPEVLAGPGETS
ncbi:MAG TPA: ATP-binding protein [Thermomicrobiales bacterium]|jgi:PAS domain S-box-containing protein